MQDEEWDDWDDRPSKSAVKRQLAELTELARVLVELPQKRLDQMPIDDETLYEGIELARRITANSGRKRQIQFLGKRLRNLDTSAIVAALNREHDVDKEATQKHHIAERWREQIMTDGISAINELIGEHPQVERSQLRALWQQAQQERSKGAPPASYRKLYKAIFSAL
jgi:ribosome-associated protein